MKDLTLAPSAEEINTYQIMAKAAHGSGLYKDKNGEAGILAIMLMARELGVPPFQALMGSITIIQGKPEISPRLMNAMIRKAGHKIEVIEETNEICSLKGVRSDTKEAYISTFTIQEAKDAHLVRAGGPWEKYPKDMLFARSMSRLGRRLFSDVIANCYVEGEIERGVEVSDPFVNQSSKKIEEIQESPSLVTKEEVDLIESYFSPEDAEYRKSLLEYYSKKIEQPMEDFSILPREHLESLIRAFEKRNKVKEEQKAAVAE